MIKVSWLESLESMMDITEQTMLEQEKDKVDLIIRNQQKLESIGHFSQRCCA